MNRIKSWLGFIRSYIIYLANPLKRSRLRNFYSLWLQPGDLCFDVGAHMGIQSQIWSSMGMNTIAIEPNPFLHRFLQQRFRKKENIKLLAQAVANEPGEQSFFISRIAPTVSTLSDDQWRNQLNHHSSFQVQWDQEIPIQTTTLDLLIEEYGRPKFIKLDIEDFEVQALESLHHPIALISFEFFSYRPQQVIRCIEEIEKNGRYEYNYSIAEKFTLQLADWKSADDLKKWILNRSPQDRHGDIIARLTEEN